MLKLFLKLSLLVSLFINSNAHGFLSKPISRNVVGNYNYGYCQWLGEIPCFGDFMSLGSTNGPDSTGCSNKAGTGGVTANQPLSYEKTKVITQYEKGSIIDIWIDITAYHGGIFQFKIQSIGNENDPNGNQWDSLTPLKVIGYQPVCTTCKKIETCIPRLGKSGTCVQIPLFKGDHTGRYKISLKLPNDLVCDHCVLQWNWITANSCVNNLACKTSEQFWNCADIKITTTLPTPITTTLPTPITTTLPTPISTNYNNCNCPINKPCRHRNIGDNTCFTKFLLFGKMVCPPGTSLCN